MAEERKHGLSWLQTAFMENFGLGSGLALAASFLVVAIVALAVIWFVHSAPPTVVTITSGPSGSSFENNAQRYLTNLAASSGVSLRILNSQGSQENYDRLLDRAAKIDLGFVQSGMTNSDDVQNTNELVSLGSVSYQPLMIFYRGPTRDFLSQFKGQKLVIGPPGSGTRSLALLLLSLNGLDSNSVALTNLDPKASSDALTNGSIDAIFLMGDSASPQIMRDLLHNPDIQLFDFTQADGYTRRITFLHKVTIPKGSLDFGRNIPNHDVTLIGPSVELVARKALHPALTDVLLEAAQDVHGNASLFKRQGEFPSAMEHDLALSPEAGRFYKTGKSFTYRYLSFRLASMVNRFVVAFIPMIVVLVPGMRLIPTLLRLRMRIRLYRWYRALMALDRDVTLAAATGGATAGSAQPLLASRLDHIEHTVKKLKVPASFADQFYSLRQHIDFVRARLPK